MKPLVDIVWFKRDLRLSDHSPLCKAIAGQRPLLLLFSFEPSWLADPDYDLRHGRFVWQSLLEMRQRLENTGVPLYVFQSEMIPLFDALHSQLRIGTLYSHEETGNARSYARDRAVAAYCRQHNITWDETPSGGVTRRLYHRINWEKNWVTRMSSALQHPELAAIQPYSLPPALVEELGGLQAPEGIEQPDKRFQPGGETPGARYLHSFLYERGRQYFRQISKPEAARTSCSRISPYLSWGNLSMRQVWQATRRAMEETGDRYNLGQFSSRLFWHCHFIQKFETECRMEFENLNRGFDAIRTETDPALVAAWQEGRTGIPLIDACMRCVRDTGYLNFRMRSMLVSFLTHHLWQPWQAGVHHLARMFLDYEPGIHFAQFQMQAGTTGVNTLRIYNPVKQAQEHDPDAVFIKKWLPELSALPVPLAHQPWTATALEQALYGFQPGIDYPLPVVDIEQSGARARDLLWKYKNDPQVQRENERILRVHTKRDRVGDGAVMGDSTTVEQLVKGEN